MSIKKNVGKVDRMIRIILGIVLLLAVFLVFYGPKTNWAYLGLIGFFFLITGISGHCPLYRWFGIGASKKKEVIMKDEKTVDMPDPILLTLKLLKKCLEFALYCVDMLIDFLDIRCKIHPKRYTKEWKREEFRPPVWPKDLDEFKLPDRPEELK